MAKYYKVLVTATYLSERIVKANSKKDVERKLDDIVNGMNLIADEPEVNTEFYERPDMDDDDVEVDLTKKK